MSALFPCTHCKKQEFDFGVTLSQPHLICLSGWVSGWTDCPTTSRSWFFFSSSHLSWSKQFISYLLIHCKQFGIKASAHTKLFFCTGATMLLEIYIAVRFHLCLENKKHSPPLKRGSVLGQCSTAAFLWFQT